MYIFFFISILFWNIFLSIFFCIVVSHYEQIRWTVDKLETMQKDFRNGKFIGIYHKENVDDIAK